MIKNNDLTQQEINKVVEALRNDQQQVHDREKWIDWLFKALIALLVYFGLEMQKDIQEIKDNQDDLKETTIVNQQTVGGINETIRRLQDYTSQPRFTQQDYIEKVSPILNSINRNRLEIETNRQDIRSLSERVLEMEVMNQQNNDPRGPNVRQ